MSIVIDYTKGFFEPSPAGESVGDISGAATLDLTTGNVFSYTPAENTTFVFSNPPTSGAAYGMTLKVTGANVTSAYDLANASYDSVSFSVLSQAEQVSSLFFKPDGTGMYVVDSSLDNVVQYSLSSAWDITSASHVQNRLVRSQEAVPTAVFFRPDGTKMYVTGSASDAIQEYNLSVAWDISTTSHLQSFSVSAQQTTPTGLFFKPDGTKFYIGGESSSIHEYSLGTAWDISTSSYVQNFSAARSKGVFFKPDGSKLYVVDEIGDKINEYTLSTAWDVSTASYVQDFSVAAQDSQPSGMYFKSDGTKMYVVGFSSDAVHQYSTTGASAPATFTYPASVDWPAGTAPDAPADGEVDTLEFLTIDGGVTYYGRRTGNAYS
jgi:sugar lactone lactonase YvrE